MRPVWNLDIHCFPSSVAYSWLQCGAMALDFAAGSCAGSAGILAGYPLDTVKVLIQCQGGGVERKYRSTLQTMLVVRREEGWRRLYRGLPTPLATVALTNAVTFGVYGAAGRAWAAGRQPGPAQAAQHGALAGSLRALVICPIG